MVFWRKKKCIMHSTEICASALRFYNKWDCSKQFVQSLYSRLFPRPLTRRLSLVDIPSSGCLGNILVDVPPQMIPKETGQRTMPAQRSTTTTLDLRRKCHQRCSCSIGLVQCAKPAISMVNLEVVTKLVDMQKTTSL